MMERRILLLVTIGFAAMSVAPAQRVDLAGISICIDPGHGGHNGANDRHIIPDPGTDFWESESNLSKGLFLKAMLEARGATVFITRITNDYPTDDDPTLTERWAFANANNVDWFHSIHSNATGSANNGTNSTLILLKENTTTRQAQFPQALPMSDAIYRGIRGMLRTQPYGVRLDYTFYGGTNGGFNLGVLSGLAMPGELSEGSFHDYYPETRRLMNDSYRKMEAYGIRDGIMEYYNVVPDTLGVVAGILTAGNYGPPVNGCRVRLLPNNVVYAGDAFNNGFFMFDGLVSGTYMLRFETSGYLRDSVSFTLSKGQVLFVDRTLSPGNSDDTAPPFISSFSPSLEDSLVPVNAIINMTFNEKLNPTSALRGTGNFTIQDVTVGGVPVYPLVRHDVRFDRSAVFCWLNGGFVAGHRYQLRVSQLKDIAGNVLANTFIFNFLVEQASLSAQLLENFEVPPLSQWNSPQSSPHTTGIISDSTSFTRSLLILPLPILYPDSVTGRMRYGWNVSVEEGLIHVATAAGSMQSTVFSPLGKKLQLYVNGDGSGTLFRLVVDDSLNSLPNSTPTAKEVGPWIAIDWIGWRLVEWVFERDEPGSWIGDGRLHGTIRINGFQLKRSPTLSSQFGEIFLDQLQLVTMQATDIADQEPGLPFSIALEQNFPNPFNPTTNLQISNSKPQILRLSILDLLGREVAVLMNEMKPAGTHTVRFNGSGLPSGIYFSALQAGNTRATRKMVLMR